MPEPVTRTHFIGVFVVYTHALIRTGLILTGLHRTRAGRRIYR